MSRLFVQLYAGTYMRVRGLPAYWLANSPPPHVGRLLFWPSPATLTGFVTSDSNLPTFVASALNALPRSGIGSANRSRRVGGLAQQSEPAWRRSTFTIGSAILSGPVRVGRSSPGDMSSCCGNSPHPSMHVVPACTAA